MSVNTLAKQIDSVLPQTQCGLCGHPACAPYAKAIANGEDSIEGCAPGGLPVLMKLAELTGSDPAPYVDGVKARSKPRLTVKVDESLCIGCTKCIAACPVDAIVGSHKVMHTVIESECTGCELCIDPCPMDCIDLIMLDTDAPLDSTKAKARYEQRNLRLAKRAQEANKMHAPKTLDKAGAQDEIARALARAQTKKQQATSGKKP